MVKEEQPDPATIHSFENHWPNIQPLVRRLIYNQAINISEWQNLFCDVHMVCSWDERGCLKLIEALKKEFVETFIEDTRTKIESSILVDDQQRLKEYVNYWTSFNSYCQSIPAAFQQLDLATRKRNPHYVPRSQKRAIEGESTVKTLLFKLWNNYILVLFSNSLQRSAMKLLSAERSGKIIESQLVVTFRESLDRLDEHNESPLPNTDQRNLQMQSNYMSNFGAKYLQEIEIFYSSRAEEVYCNSGLLDYAEWALQTFDNEQQKARFYLGSKSTFLDKVRKVCSKILIVNYADEADFLEESEKFINSNDGSKLKLLYVFMSHKDGSFCQKFFALWLNHIVRSGLDHLTSLSPIINSNCEKLVGGVIETYNQFAKMIKISFSDEARAKSMLHLAFELIVNDSRAFKTTNSPNDTNLSTPTEQGNYISQPESKFAELLTNYCDILMRRTPFSRKLTSDDINEHLKELLFVMRFVKDKEALVKHHKNHLMRRLVLSSSISIEREKKFVANLKELPEIQTESLHKLDRMFEDMYQSEKILDECRKTLVKSNLKEDGLNNNNNNNNNFIITKSLEERLNGSLSIQDNNNRSSSKICDSISIKVLNPCAWNKTADKFSSVNIPEEILSILPSFDIHYNNHYTGRQLDWYHQLSNGTVTFTTENGKFDLEVTAPQLSILSSFNDRPRESLTLIELESKSKLSPPELRRAMWVS